MDLFMMCLPFMIYVHGIGNQIDYITRYYTEEDIEQLKQQSPDTTIPACLFFFLSVGLSLWSLLSF